MIIRLRITILFRNYAVIHDPSLYIMDHYMFIISNKKEESISASGVKEGIYNTYLYTFNIFMQFSNLSLSCYFLSHK